jgi:hypothetical protein
LVVGEGAIDEHGAGEAVEGGVKSEDAVDERENGGGGFILAVVVQDAEESVACYEAAGGGVSAVRKSEAIGQRKA